MSHKQRPSFFAHYMSTYYLNETQNMCLFLIADSNVLFRIVYILHFKYCTCTVPPLQQVLLMHSVKFTVYTVHQEKTAVG